MTLKSTLQKYLLLGLFMIAAIGGKATHYYVDSSAVAGANNGTSWANAYLNLQTAINFSNAGDSIWVADGHYFPGVSGDNLAWFDLKIGVAMLGGFQGLSGAQESSASQRNFYTNVTVLSGDLDRNGIHSAADAYHVVNAHTKDTTAVVDGFVIELGNAIGASVHGLGGAVFSFGGGASFLNCVFQNNYSFDGGGAVYAVGSFNFKRCLFRNNQTGGQGGAINQSSAGAKIRIHNCAFVGNSATSFAGAITGAAGDYQLFNCTFTGNTASFGAAFFISSSTAQVRNCILWGNPGPDIFGSPIVNRCIVEGGYAPGTNIMTFDPQFSDPIGRIKACSPAVDVADSLGFIAEDYDGNPRPIDGDGNGIAKWDLGAFEAQFPRAFPSANAILGQNPGCANSFNNLFRVTTDNTPLNGYQWSLSSGGSIAIGATNDSVRVNWSGVLGSYTLTVVETNLLTGCSTTNTAVITLSAPPTVSLVPAPRDSICTGDSVLVTANGVGVSRQWYRNGLSIPGATGTTIQAAIAGNYNCIVVGANGCGDSAAVALKLYLRPLPVVNFTTSVPVPICQGDVVTITGSPGASHQWFRNGSIILGATNNAYATGLAGIYNMRQTDIHGCRDSAATGLSLIVNALPVVTVNPNAIDTICIGDSLAISATASNTVSRQWFRNGASIPGSNVNPYQAMLTGIYNCRITDTNGCADTAAVGHNLISNDFVNPVAVCQNISVQLNGSGNATLTPAMLNNGSSDNCRIATYALSTTSLTCANLGSNTVTLTVTDLASRTSTCAATVTVLDSIRPTVVCSNATVYLGTNGQLTLNPTVVGGASTDNCAITSQIVSPSSFVCADTGSHVVTYTATDGSGNNRNCVATVVVEDSTRPAAACRTATIFLDGAGNAATNAAAINNGSTDNCGINSLSISRTTFNCADVPGVFVTLTLQDISGNVATCQGYVRVIDSVSPIPLCRDTTIYINNSGIANLTPANLNNGSSDNCLIDSIWISQSSFTCVDTGLNVVTMSIIDADTNLSTCISNVTILDTVPPQAICTDTTFYLNALGIATVNPSVFGINSFDNCTFFDTSYVDIGTYTCGQTGLHVVELFVVDVNGRVDSCTGNVTILDNLPPIALCQNIAPILDPGGNVTITASMVNNGTSDNCTIASITASPTSFTCANVGANNVVLTATDIFGNSSTCSAVVTVTDTVAPVAVCQNFTTYLNGSGTTTIATSNINNGSTDNCAIASISLSQTTFVCANTGSNAVSLTITDTYGNAQSCAATVTVLDTIRPVAVCQAYTAYLDGNGQFALLPAMVDNGSSDNCGIASSAVNPTTFSCGQIGPNSVTLTVTDPSGLQRTCLANVTVLDSLAPVPVCTNDTFALNPAGSFTLTAVAVSGGSTDNCAIATRSLSNSAFDCSDLGANAVSVTFTDASGNTSSCAITVTIVDTTSPNAVCLNDTLYLDAAGNATLLVAQVNGGSSDACGIANLSISSATFTCAQVGANAVTLSATDSSANVGTCIANILVLDSIRPQISCNSITVNLDSNGTYLLDGSLLTAGSTDICGIDTAYTTPFLFNCQNIGPNSVSVYVEDPSGNLDSCTTTFTLNDNLAPFALCDSITLQLGSNGAATLTPLQLGPNSFDNCGLDSTWISRDTFTCADLGWVAVTLSLWDSTGNQSNCTGHVNVVDTSGISAAGVNLGPDTTTCNGDTLVFSGPAGMSSYLWSTGETSQSITVTAAGTYFLAVVSPVGCDGADTVTVSAFVTNDPNLRSESGELVVCIDDTLELLVDPNYVSYQWSTGSTADTTLVTTGGNYAVIVTDANGCSLLRSVQITFVPFPGPNPIVTPGGNVGMCENTSLNLNVGVGYAAYLWNNALTTPQITAFIPGTYSVQVWNGFGCHETSDPVIISTLSSPFPDIQANADTMYTNTVGIGYQWFNGNFPILGALNSSYIAPINGLYSVRVYYANGCSEISNGLPYAVGISEELSLLQAITLYPNPSNGQVHLRPETPVRKPLEIRVNDLYGRELKQFSLRQLKEDVLLDLGELAAGIYLLEIRTADANLVHKLVIE